MLSIHHLRITFTMYDVGLTQQQHTVITGLDLDVQAGELVAVVGASGSGKSLLAHAVLGILPHNAHLSGDIRWHGQPLSQRDKEQLRGRHIALIPQTVAALDPLLRVGAQVRRTAELRGLRGSEADTAVQQVFTRYGLSDSVQHQFPFQLSGGMARRVLTATATIGTAELVIADEPTPGLHPDVVHETLRHLRELADTGRGVILITHDLAAALHVADRVAVFYAGSTVEVAHASDFTAMPPRLRHPYTQALWRALPQNDFQPLPGAPPTPDDLPSGCLFADRCSLVTAACRAERPALRSLAGGLVRCIHAQG
jgi:peptide/nickel transport system ATP-binding protein